MSDNLETTDLAARRLRARNWAVLGLLTAFIVALYLVTLIRVQP